MTVDANKMEQFLGKFVNDLGATAHAGMVVIGERLGLYKALAAGPLTPAELAAITCTDERYVSEWLASQAAGGYLTYNPDTQKFGMTRRASADVGERGRPGVHTGCIRTRSRVIGGGSSDY